MESQLTVHLFHTLCFAPKGLKLKLRVRTVKKNFECFDEVRNPACTILSHGLFLAKPTPTSVKDPLLLFVSNQLLLQDKQLISPYSVWLEAGEHTLSSDHHVCLSTGHDAAGAQSMPSDQMKLAGTSQSKEKTNQPQEFDSRRLTRVKTEHPANIPLSSQNIHVSIIRNGIEKKFPDSQRLRDWMAKQTATYPEAQLAKGDSALISQQNGQSKVIADHTERLRRYCHHRVTRKAISYLRSVATDGLQHHSFFRLFSDINSRFATLLKSITYYKSFIAPTEQKDLATFRSYKTDCQEELKWLAKVVEDFLTLPFFNSCSKFPRGEAANHLGFSGIVYKSFENLRASMETFKYMATSPIDWINDYQLAVEIEKLMNFNDLYSIFCYLEKRPSHSHDRYIGYIEAKLRSYPSEFLVPMIPKVGKNPRVPYSKQEIRRLQESTVLDNYIRIHDKFLEMISDNKFCSFKSLKSMESLRLKPTIEPTIDLQQKCSVAAIFCCRETTIFAMKTNCLKIMRKTEQIASLDLPTEFPRILTMNQDYEDVQIQHFTGRFLVRFDLERFAQFGRFYLLDLWPYCEAIPQPAKLHKYEFCLDEDDKGTVPYVYCCTDEFICYFSSEGISEERLLRGLPSYLRIFPFDPVDGFRAYPAINCAKNFREIFTNVDAEKIYQTKTESTQICWSKDLTKLFYANYSHELTLICFRFSRRNLELENLAYGTFNMTFSFAPEHYSKNLRFSLSALELQNKTYIVVDTFTYDPWETILGRYMLYSPTTLDRRALFVVHNHRLHQVHVNGREWHDIPRNIGQRIENPNYNTSHCSLLHKRRVFSSDRVIYQISRLDYKLV